MKIGNYSSFRFKPFLIISSEFLFALISVWVRMDVYPWDFIHQATNLTFDFEWDLLVLNSIEGPQKHAESLQKIKEFLETIDAQGKSRNSFRSDTVMCTIKKVSHRWNVDEYAISMNSSLGVCL